MDKIKDKADDILEKTDLDEKLMEKANEAKEKIKEAELGEKVKSAAADIKEKADEVLEKTDIDDKIKAKAEEALLCRKK